MSHKVSLTLPMRSVPARCYKIFSGAHKEYRYKTMDRQRLEYIFRSGKNPKYIYYTRAYAKLLTPRIFLRLRLAEKLKAAKRRADYEYMLQRVNYYNKLSAERYVPSEEWEQKAVEIGKQRKTGQSVYFLDSMEYARWFAPRMQWVLLPGDVIHVPDVPSIVKSRPIEGDNANSVLLKLDKVRHFVYMDDKLDFKDKKDMAIFRGGIKTNANRQLFMNKHFDNPRINAGATDNLRPEWKKELLTLPAHLAYKFILSLEGNDVASNLKWIMSSHSVAIMPRPRYETWFMEGTLKPDYHYIEVKPDFSDLDEKMDYYIQHPDEAQAIVRQANEYVAQFRDEEREDLVSLMTLDKYFNITNGRK